MLLKFLVDNALSPRISEGLKKNGFDSVHVRDYNMQTAVDKDIFKRAIAEERIIISADTDFGTLLALYESQYPSVILFRHDAARLPELQLDILMRVVKEVEEELLTGSIVVIDEKRMRIRKLPISG